MGKSDWTRATELFPLSNQNAITAHPYSVVSFLDNHPLISLFSSGLTNHLPMPDRQNFAAATVNGHIEPNNKDVTSPPGLHQV